MNAGEWADDLGLPASELGIAAAGFLLCVFSRWRQRPVAEGQSDGDGARPRSTRIDLFLTPMFCLFVLGVYGWGLLVQTVVGPNDQVVSLRWMLWLSGALFAVVFPGDVDRSCRRPACLGLLLMSLSGALLMVGAVDLIDLALSLELCWLPVVFLLAVGTNSQQRCSALLRWEMSAMLGSVCTLFGMSLLYVLTASTRFAGIAKVLAASTGADWPVGMAATTFSLLVIGVGIRIGLIPFRLRNLSWSSPHLMWTMGWVAVVSLFVLAAAIRPLVDFPWMHAGRIAEGLLFLLALVALTLSNLRLWSERRLSLVLMHFAALQMGIILCGLATILWRTTQSSGAWVAVGLDPGMGRVVCSGLGTAALALTGMSAVLLYLRGEHPLNEKNQTAVHLQELSGLVHRHPLAAVCLSACLMALSGWPLMPGFWVRVELLVAFQPLLVESPTVLILGLLILANLMWTAAACGKLLLMLFVNPPLGRLSRGGTRSALYAAVVVAALLTCAGVAPRLMGQLSQAGVSGIGSRASAARPPGIHRLGVRHEPVFERNGSQSE